MRPLLNHAARARLRTVCLGITLFWFVVGGAAHFFATDFFVRITPPWVPAPRAVVLWSGVLELLLAACLLSQRLRPWAGVALIGVIFAVSFANLHMWLHPELFPEAPRWIYTARLILQVGLVWCVWFGTRVPPAISTAAARRPSPPHPL